MGGFFLEPCLQKKGSKKTVCAANRRRRNYRAEAGFFGFASLLKRATSFVRSSLPFHYVAALQYASDLDF
jgi:hypothetical protein